jgi:cell pole-organizing protein PopZ
MSEDENKREDGEPSMEDILASIRRILSDDNNPDEEDVDPSDPARPSPQEQDEDANVVEFSNPPREPELEDELFEEPDPNLFDSEPEDDTPFDPPPAALGGASNVLELTPQMRLAAEKQLISNPVRDQSTDVLTQLARAILDQRELTVATSQVTIEGMVREMLRPLLREYLDKNLPHIIERLVKQEIDQMVNRAEQYRR